MPSLESKVDLVRQYLDARVASQTIYSANIANGETPNYKAKLPTFKTILDTMPGVSGSKNDPHYKVDMKVRDSTEPVRVDGNNVNMEKQMAALAENSMRYMSAVKILSREMAIERYAATSGGR